MPKTFRLPDRTTWIVGLGTTAALAGQGASPWIVSSLAGSAGLDVEQASLMVTAEMLAMGLMMMALAPIVHRLPGKAVALCAVAIILAAQILSLFASGVVLLGGARALSGFAFGALFAVASAKGAAADNPEKTYALAGVMSLLIGTAINPILGFASADYGHIGVFSGLAFYCLMVAFPLLFMRFGQIGRAIPVIDGSAAPISPMAASGVMAIMALLAIATNGVFVFVATIAGTVGLKGAALGSAMSVVSLVSSSGALLASRMGTRYGTLPPLGGGLLVMGCSLFWLTTVTTQTTFWISFTLVVITYWFLWPYILGLAVSVDPQGRVVAATGSAKIFAGAVGSGAAGYTAAHYGLASYGAIAFGSCFGAALLSIYVIRLVRGGPVSKAV